MSNWHYVAIAYTLTWGALAIYALVLARRVVQSRDLERTLRQAQSEAPHAAEQDATLCDAPPVP